jgi:triose/dihydroxyacetone kinase / FAD-AMP lyase (cyclizing)
LPQAHKRAVNYPLIRSTLAVALQAVIAAEPDITHYDTVVGDGDCGTGLKRGAEAVLKALEKQTDDAITLLSRIASAVESSMDGTSGALYAIFLNALTASLRAQDTGDDARGVDAGMWADASEQALASLGKYTPAKEGDRTVMDALEPFVKTLKKEGLRKAAGAADAGARKTKGMKASLGRTVYVGGDGYKEVPDPGAYGLARFLTALSEGYS